MRNEYYKTMDDLGKLWKESDRKAALEAMAKQKAERGNNVSPADGAAGMPVEEGTATQTGS